MVLMAGKGDKTSFRTNWKKWRESKALPERVVKTWQRDKQGNLIDERENMDNQDHMQDVSDWLESSTGVKPQVAMETYTDGKLVSKERLTETES